MHEQIETK